MEASTGSRLLDAAALDAFRRWRFKPGMVRGVRIPVHFTMDDQVRIEYKVRERPVDEALAQFLGKGTVAKGSIPEYPHFPPWTYKQGKGRYELHVQKDGKVAEVKILKRSGDDTFDRVIVETLRKWRLRRGPLILELPLRFTLTPLKYWFGIPKDR
jgi:TonB family protein